MDQYRYREKQGDALLALHDRVGVVARPWRVHEVFAAAEFEFGKAEHQRPEAKIAAKRQNGAANPKLSRSSTSGSNRRPPEKRFVTKRSVRCATPARRRGRR